MAKLKLSDEEIREFESRWDSFPAWEADLERRVSGLRDGGAGAEVVAEVTDRERAAFYAARSRAFVRATQGKGKPGSKQTHGDGKRAES